MRITELATSIGAKILNPDIRQGEIEHVYAGDRVSDLLDNASVGTLLVSNLTGEQLVKVAELMDVTAICLVSGHQAGEQDLKIMSQHGIVVMVTLAGLFETCGRLYKCMFDKTQNLK